VNLLISGTRWRNRLGRQVSSSGAPGSIPTKDDPLRLRNSLINHCIYMLRFQVYIISVEIFIHLDHCRTRRKDMSWLNISSFVY
jgi:hypothetical protein